MTLKTEEKKVEKKLYLLNPSASKETEKIEFKYKNKNTGANIFK